MEVDNAAVNTTAQPFVTPRMVAERALTGEAIPQWARDAMTQLHSNIRKEIGEEFDRTMNVNFTSLNKAMDDCRTQTKTYVDNAHSALITKFDIIFNAKSKEIEKQFKALEQSMKEVNDKLSQDGSTH